MGKASQCLRKGLGIVGRRWREEGKGAGASLTPEEFALHSGRIEGSTRLATRRGPEAVIRKEGRWSSDSFMVCVRTNMEDPVFMGRCWSMGWGSLRDG